MQLDSTVVKYMGVCEELGRAEATFDEVQLREHKEKELMVRGGISCA